MRQSEKQKAASEINWFQLRLAGVESFLSHLDIMGLKHLSADKVFKIKVLAARANALIKLMQREIKQ